MTVIVRDAFGEKIASVHILTFPVVCNVQLLHSEQTLPSLFKKAFSEMHVRPIKYAFTLVTYISKKTEWKTTYTHMAAHAYSQSCM